MNDADHALMLTKFWAAVAYAREIAPDLLGNPRAAEELHKALPAPTQPTWTEPGALTNLQTESE